MMTTEEQTTVRRIAAELGELGSWIDELDVDGASSAAELARNLRRDLDELGGREALSR